MAGLEPASSALTVRSLTELGTCLRVVASRIELASPGLQPGAITRLALQPSLTSPKNLGEVVDATLGFEPRAGSNDLNGRWIKQQACLRHAP